jgi:Uma2 family endonuclease
MTHATFPSPSDPTRPSAGTVLSAADVARLPTTLATTDVDYELHDGKLVVTFPPDANHGFAQARLLAALSLRAKGDDRGRVLGRVGVVLRRNPDHLLCPDAAFLTAAQVPPRVTPEDYLLTVPELVVEIHGRNDTPLPMAIRVRDYLAAGAVLVWVADPDARTVTAHRANQPPVVFTAADTLTADPVIPGFAVAVEELLPQM